MRYQKIELWNGGDWFTALADWTLSVVDEWDDLSGDPLLFDLVARPSGEAEFARYRSVDGYIAQLPRLTKKTPTGYLSMIVDIPTGDFAVRDAPDCAGSEWVVHHFDNDEAYRAGDDYALHLLNPKLGNDFESLPWNIFSHGLEFAIVEESDE
jgi:hypothetical protein